MRKTIGKVETIQNQILVNVKQLIGLVKVMSEDMLMVMERSENMATVMGYITK